MKIYYKIGIIVFGLVILSGLAWFLFLRSGSPSTQQPKGLDQILAELSGNDPSNFVTGSKVSQPPPVATSQPVEPPVKLAPQTPEQQAEQGLEQFTARFIERWGTYSNQTDLSHFNILTSQMTPRLQNFLSTYTAEIRQQHPYQQGYYGVTTRVVAVNILNFNMTAARLTAEVGTRRTTTTDTDPPETYNQTASLDLVKVNGEWQVDGVFWQ